MQTVRPSHDFDLRRAKFLLGVAYRNVGRFAQARDALAWALRDYESHEPADRPVVLEAQEQWGRLLLDHPRSAEDSAAARAALGRVIAAGGRTAAYTTALAEAHADLARDWLRLGKTADAGREMTAAESALRRIKAEYDVRIADELLLLKGEILAAQGRLPEARAAAADAMRAGELHDSPQSPQISRAQLLIASLGPPSAT